MWSFVLTTLDGTSLGEIRNASNRKVSLPLGRMNGGSFTVRLDHRRADEILSGDCLVKAYEEIGKKPDGTPNKPLRTLGEIITAEEVVDENGQGSIAVTFGDAWYRLLHRLLGKSATGFSMGSPVSQVGIGLIIGAIVNNANADGDTGIRVGSTASAANTYVGPWYYSIVAEKIAELCAQLDGPDIEFVAQEPTKDASGVALWTMNTYAAKGSLQANAIFEFATGKKNVKSYKRPVTKDGLMNSGFSLPPGFPDNGAQAVLTASDPTSITQRGLYEATVPGDLTVDPLRQKLVEAHLKVRKNPRQIISFEPHAHNAPQFGVDYNVGDVVRFRAMRNNEIRIDANVRVYGVDFDIDDNGNASTSIQVVPEG